MNRRQLLVFAGSTALGAGCIGQEVAVGDADPTRQTDSSTASTGEPLEEAVPLDPVDGVWPTYQFTVARTGYTPTRGTSHSARDGHWTAKIGPSSRTPAVVDGTVYVGGRNGAMYALEATTGKRRWKSPLVASNNEMSWTTPAVASETAYVGSRAAIHALDANTGETRWEFDGETDRFAGEDVAVVDDMVIIQPDSTTIVALHAETGTIRWRYGTGTSGIPTNVAVANGSVFFATVDSTVYSLSLTSGTQQWKTNIEGPGRISSLAVDEGRVILTSDIIHAVDAKTGDELWRFNTVEKTTEASLLSVGRAAASGGPQVSPPAITDGTVYVKTEENEAIALKASTGQLDWSVEIRGRLTAPVVVEDRVYLTEGNTVQTFDAASGDQADWQFIAQDYVSPPVVVDGVVFVQAGERYLQALTGEKRS